MRVLVSNDDGVDAEGLQTLIRYLSKEHEVWTVAPDGQRSGMSHAVTLHDKVRLRDLGGQVYACSGTPADCILYAVLGAVPCTPDIVVSGINHGPNIGTDIIYSGTVAAARQAALMNVPGVAVSLVLDGGKANFDAAAAFIGSRLQLFKELWQPDMFFNVNVPCGIQPTTKAEVTRPAIRIYNDVLAGETGADGEVIYMLHGTLNGARIEEGTDWAAVEEGKISVSAVKLHPLNQSEKESYHSTQFR